MGKQSFLVFIVLFVFCTVKSNGQDNPQTMAVEAFDSLNLRELYPNPGESGNIKQGLFLIENFLKKKNYHTSTPCLMLGKGF
jgi:hypothetical protein